MEIDEHLKYTLLVDPCFRTRSRLLTRATACSLIPAQEQESRWFQGVSSRCIFPKTQY
jgi:hypothetical protein